MHLTSVEIPDSVTTISYSAFTGNFLQNVILGKSVTEIGKFAFNVSGIYGGTNTISKVVNKSGNSFDWADIFMGSYDSSIFVYGTYSYTLNNKNYEIAIVKN